MPFLNQILLILTTSPGNLTYHVVLAFSIAGALQSSINHWRRSGFPQGQRMVIGLALLLLVQLIQFASTALAWQGLTDPRLFLPPLDRAVILLGLVIIAWLWLFPEPSRLGDAASLFFGLLVITCFILSLIWWSSQPFEIPYNGTWADIGSDTLAIFLIGASALVLLLRRPNSWGIGLAFFGLMLMGFLSRWIAPQAESDYAGMVRLAQVMAYPWLFSLPQRFPLPAEASVQSSPTTSGIIKEIRRYRTDPSFIIEFLEVSNEKDLRLFGQKMTRLVSELMLADITLLCLPPNEVGQVAVIAGYDLIKQMPIESFVVETPRLPVLASALRRGRLVRLPSSSTSNDLLSLAQALNLERAGHLLSAPLISSNGSVRLGFILLLPYSNRGWTVEDQNNLARLAEAVSSLLNRLDAGTVPSAVSAHLETEIYRQLEDLQEQLNQERQRSENLAELVADLEACQRRISELEEELINLQIVHSRQRQASLAEVEEVKGDLRLALEEIDRLNKALADAGSGSFELDSGKPGSSTLPVQIVHQLKQPLQSLHENFKLFIGEASAQFPVEHSKSAERVRASLERLTLLIEDLLRSIELENLRASLKPVDVDLNDVIGPAVDSTLPQFREKNLTLCLDVPERFPLIHTDPKALQQVLSSLLSVAGSSSPENGQVSLHMRIEIKENEPNYLLIQVVDSGPGIPSEELPRLFSQIWPPAHINGEVVRSLISTRALIEAQQGRIWADTQIGQGTSFSVLLPIEILSAPHHATGEAGI